LLEAYDAEHPEAPIFGTSGVAISDDDRRRLLSLYRTGLPAGDLARQFLVGRTTVGRVVRELIVDEVLGQPWEHVHCPAFDEPDAAETVLADAPVAEPSQSLTEPLKGDEEQVLFRQYNFLKWQLAQARDELSPSDLSPAELERLAHVHDRAMAVRNRLVLANLRLVIHLAKRHLRSGSSSLDELVSDGTVSLMQAIERFDYSRGVRFSTYSSWAILKNYAKSIPRELRARSAVTQDSQEIVEAAPDASEAERNQSALRKVLRSLVTHMLLELGERERQILVARFGLEGKQTETLEQIGQRYDITRERVRQIEARALRKLAAVADPELLEELAAPASSSPH
ncbi:sigma-70 family RNA polymerase sigma factor, partial [bacterium]|nr:sigma-70 family RNA polymerase sigma factor [bacterium]